MAERFNAPVLKTGDLKGSGGSNPSSSAAKRRPDGRFFYCIYLLKSITNRLTVYLSHDRAYIIYHQKE